MLAIFTERGHDRRGKTHRGKGYHVSRPYISLDQAVQYLIVPRQRIHYPPLEKPAALGLLVKVFRPAFIAAELLVRASVPDGISTFKTHRQMPFILLVAHNSVFVRTNITCTSLISNSPAQVFLFLIKLFSFSYHRRHAKINLIMIKKIFA